MSIAGTYIIVKCVMLYTAPPKFFIVSEKTLTLQALKLTFVLDIGNRIPKNLRIRNPSCEIRSQKLDNNKLRCLFVAPAFRRRKNIFNLLFVRSLDRSFLKFNFIFDSSSIYSSKLKTILCHRYEKCHNNFRSS